MPKPTVWAEDIDQILRVISEEQAQLLQLAEEQHASFSMSVQLAFARMERSDLLSRGGFGRRGRGLCAASPCDLCTAEGNEDDTQEVFQDVPDQTDMLSSDGFDAHQHSSSLRQIDSTFSVPTSPSRAKSKKSANSKPTAEDLLGLDHFIDRSKAWTDLLAGMLVLINSFVMLAAQLHRVADPNFFTPRNRSRQTGRGVTWLCRLAEPISSGRARGRRTSCRSFDRCGRYGCVVRGLIRQIYVRSSHVPACRHGGGSDT